MKQMDRAEMLAVAGDFLESAAAVLSETGNIPMSFLIVGPDKAITIVTDEPQIINSPKGKSALAQRAREEVKKLNAYVVFVISDTYMTKFTGEDSLPLAEYVAEIGSEEAERLGLVKRREAIACQIYTRDANASATQFYKRDDDEKIIFEEREEQPFNLISSGRLSGFFND